MGEPDPATPAGGADLTPGEVFHGVYEVERCIKRGGMGAVYEVLHTPTRRRRALKVMLPQLVADPEMRSRFKLEATVAAGIDSEHIVETLDAGIDEATGMPFIVMELLKGAELASLLRKRGRLPPEEALVLLTQAALALDKTHAAGIVHRDLKPENLFVTERDDGSSRLKILDFGVAKIVAEGTTCLDATVSVGSPVYMSPEQIKGEGRIGTKADLHALGHVAFTMLVGVPYWAPERREVGGLIPFLMRVLRGNPEPASARAAKLGAALPATFDAWFEQATAVDPERRFAGAGQMVLELARALGLDAPAILSARKHAHAVRAEPEEGSADGCGAATVARAPSPAVEERTEAPTVGVLPAVRVRSRGKLLAGATVASGLVLVGALLVVRHWTAGPPSLPEASPVHSSFGGSISPAKAASPPERPSPASAAAIASSVEGPASASAAPPSLLVEGSRSRASGAPSRSPAGRTPPSPAPSSVAAKRHDPLETF